MLARLIELLARIGPPIPEPTRINRAPRLSIFIRVALLILGAGTLWVLQWIRQAGGFPTLWAEDGVLFVQDALTHGLIENITTPAGGYVIVLSRLIAQLVVVFPIAQAPTVVAIAGITATTICAIWVYYVADQWLDSRLLRMVIAGSVVVVPIDIGGGELFGTILDLQWPLLFTLFWTLLFIPRRRGDGIAAAGMAALASLTSGLSVVLVPLAIVVICADAWEKRGSIARSLPALIVVAGALIQVAAHFVHPHDPALGLGNAHSTSLRGWIDIVTVRVFGQAFLGAHLTSRLWFTLRGWTGLVCLIPVAIISVVAVCYATRRLRWLIGASLTAAVVIAIVPLVVRPGLAGAMRPQIITHQPFFAGARYMYCPMLLTLTAAVAAADSLRIRGVVAGRTAALTVALAITVVAAIAFRLPAIRSSVPTWKAQLSDARLSCHGVGAVVFVAPDETWKVVIPCERLK